ncbi:MAG: GTPase ObgE, partial [Acidimicrobiales bacterium]|nr:GTPase ObgE [Acidimicrobiales bacterium]
MPGFIDQAQLHAKGGNGGAGAVVFRREAHVAKGGPDGGDGGSGGDVVLESTSRVSSLLSFKDQPFRRGGDGTHGGPKKQHGKKGSQEIVPV